MVAAILLAAGAAAQAPRPDQVPPAAAPAPNQAAPAETPSVIPGYRPGFIDAFGRWMQESTAGFNANVKSGWEALPGRGMTDAAADAASSAAKSTTDAAKGAAQGAAEATQGAAAAMGNVARDTAGALTRLPGTRIVAGRERCPLAPNGAPDCRIAAAALCKANGLPGGTSVDFETAEVCPADAMMARWRGEEVTCRTENYVTRSLCQ